MLKIVFVFILNPILSECLVKFPFLEDSITNIEKRGLSLDKNLITNFGPNTTLEQR